MERLVRRRYLILCTLLIILSVSLSASWYSRRAFGDITIEKQDIVRDNGRVVSFRTYKPSVITYGQLLPAVLTIHGISSSGAMMDAFNIELARRNFTVISVDIAGHGRSSERFGFDSFFEAIMDAYDAVRYVQLNDPETDDSLYGILGHSLGAGISLLFNNVSVQPFCTVIIGGGMGNQFGGLSLPINESTPNNLMIASGLFDELVSQQLALETLKIATGLSDPVPEAIYGDFTAGTARKLVFSPTNHLFEMSDSKIVTHSVDWLARSLQGLSHVEQSMLSPAQHIYQYTSFFDFFASVSFVFSILVIAIISYSYLPTRLKPEQIEGLAKPLENRAAIRYSLIMGLVTSVLFLLLMLMGFVFEFTGLSFIPVSFGTALSLISILTGLVVFVLSKKILGKERVLTLTPELQSGRNILFKDFAKSFIVTLPLLIWILGFSIVSRAIFDNALMLTFAVDSGAALLRFLYMIALTFLMLPYFYADTLWLNASVGIVTKWNDLHDMTKRIVRALASRLLAFLIIIAILYSAFLAMINLGFIMFIALLMLPFAVLFGITGLNTVVIGGITRSNLSSALFNAILFAVIIASMFQLV